MTRGGEGGGPIGNGFLGSPYGNCLLLVGGGLKGGSTFGTCCVLFVGGIGIGGVLALGGNGPAPIIGTPFGGNGGAGGKASIRRLGNGGHKGASGLGS